MAAWVMALALAGQAAAAGPAQAPPSGAPAGLAQVRLYHEVALDPAGARIATVETDELATSELDPHETVVVRARSSGEVINRFDPCATCQYADPAWSPDGRALAFVASDRNARTAAVIVVRDAKPAVALNFPGLLADPRWSPDGQTLAVLATERPRKQTGATQAGAALVGEIGRETDEQRVAVFKSLELAPGEPIAFLSPADTFVYEYDWTPDGKGFVVSEAKGDGDNNWWVAKLARVGVDGTFREIAAPPAQIKFPRVSPDGKTVAFIGGLMSDFGPTGGDLWTAPLDGGPAVDRTPGFKGSFSSLMWRKSGLFATALVGDQTALMSVDPQAGATRTLWSAAMGLAAAEGRVSLDRDGKVMAAEAQTFTTAPQVIAGPVGKPRPVTHENDAVAAQVTAQSLTWKSEGYDVQGWLLGPKDLPVGHKAPMIVEVHGGPSAAVQPHFEWKDTVYDLVAHGYYVLMPNPRGSFGQGEAFTKANVKDFGGGDLRDILAGVDAAERAAPIDDARLGVYGHSYGGFMTMWTVTHSQRFKAAVAGAGIADWVAYYGQNGIDQWMVPFFGSTAYDDPSVYDRLSPIRYIKAVKTPTFIYVGERDVECPPAQSLEFHHGLDAMGVSNSLVIYPGEGHGIRLAEHKADLKRRILGWFDQHLGAPGSPKAETQAQSTPSQPSQPAASR
jgi:dipeptidyl aminopeptidase/acylaminoacyl peptidase